MTIHDATEVAYKNGYEQGKKDAVASILSPTDATKWIPVTERLPNSLEVVWVYRKFGLVGTDVCFKCWGRNRWLGKKNKLFPVTHWMPLPEPPKEEKQ